jgi:lipoprotein-anchoring transpeptidase ErfK/SrfK
MAFAMLATLLASPFMGTVRHAAADDWAPPSTVYIPETGHSIDGVFLDYWRSNGGANAFGNPISAELTQNGHIVQYYQYARFEYWPEDANGNVVHLGNIGAELRPTTIVRSNPGAITKLAFSNVNAEVAQISKAWLPLDKSEAKKPKSDTWVFVSATGHSVSNGFKTFWDSATDYLGNPLTQEFQVKGVTYQIFERGELAWKPGASPWLVPIGETLVKKYAISMAATDQGDIPTYSEDLFVKPPDPEPVFGAYTPSGTDGEHWVDVDLTTQSLTAYEGDIPVLYTLVSTGRPGFDTPTGEFHVLVKLESQTMSGVIGGEYYNVPDVPWVMYFTDEGHALHGTYWHNNFGNVMSHGCVNLPMDVAEWMYGWADIGMRVEIHY